MIYLLRHGLDDEKYMGGWSNVELTSKGIIDVEDIAKFISNGNYKIDRIITSDVKRAWETTKIVNLYLNKEVVVNQSLRELNKGNYNGVLKSLVPNEFKNVSSIDTKYPNGESMREFYERIKKDLNNILIDNSLIVTHRGVINMIYYIMNNQQIDMNKKQFGVTHASLHAYNPNTKVIRKVR